jgi:hypothetical protein
VALWVEAVNALGMLGPEIGTAPPVTGSALVNLPVWLWTETGGAVWPQDGPLTATASDPVLPDWVDAFAEPVGMEWDMGDGRDPVVCRDAGQAWEPGLDLRVPGECHHVYVRASRHQPDGQYEITAVTTWRVWWDINGVFDGEVELPVGSTTTYQVDEVQVLTGTG